ncbi:MAG: nuclease [Bacteroidetes bacterium]|nr:nuclease [Bacteroidota bacterium]
MNHLEAEIQEACVRWFQYQYSHIGNLLFAVPNGGSRNKIEAVNLKRQGVTPGVSDLILFQKRETYGALCIEMKAGKGTQSDAQKVWQKTVERFGYKYVICYSLEEFINEVNGYMNLGSYDRR